MGQSTSEQEVQGDSTEVGFVHCINLQNDKTQLVCTRSENADFEQRLFPQKRLLEKWPSLTCTAEFPPCQRKENGLL